MSLSSPRRKKSKRGKRQKLQKKSSKLNIFHFQSALKSTPELSVFLMPGVLCFQKSAKIDFVWTEVRLLLPLHRASWIRKNIFMLLTSRLLQSDKSSPEKQIYVSQSRTLCQFGKSLGDLGSEVDQSILGCQGKTL